MNQYLTVKEVAERLCICRASIYNYLKTNPDFPRPRKLGRNTRFISEEVDKFMNSAPCGVYGEGR